MTWVSLLDDFHSNPKVIAAGLECAGLYARALSYCGDYLTDGFVPEEWLHGVVGRKRSLILKCVEVGLILEVKGGYEIPQYLDYNPPKAYVMELRKKRSKSGQKGANKRWADSKRHSTPDSTPHGTPQGFSYSKTDGKTIARAREDPDPDLEAEESLVKGRTVTRPPAANSLPFKHELILTQLLEAIGAAADNGTPTVVRKYATHLPEGAIAKVTESVKTAPARDRAKYAIGALKSECLERGITA